MTRSLLPILWSDCYLSSGHRFRFSNRPHKLLTATTWNHFLTIIGLLAAVAGMICLFSGSFSENQFKDAVKLKVVVFTILPLLVLVFLWKATKCIEVIEKGKHSQGSRFNLYSAGSFSAFALVISSKGEKAMELGVFDFLLGLTMDASMEIPGNDGVNLLYMLGAFVYCASLIFIKSYLESFMLSRSISGARQGNIPDGSTGRIEGTREDAANEIVSFGIYDLATEDSGETIGLPHVTTPELMGLNMLGAFVYCASLIFIRSYQESFMSSRDISGAHQQESIPDGSTDQVEGAREDAADETVNPVTYDPATEDFGETIELPHITMPEFRLLSNAMQGLKNLFILDLHRDVRTEDALLGLLYFLPRKCLDLSHLVEIDLNLSAFRRLFGDVVIDGVKLASELFFEDWQKNRVRTDASEFEIESLSHGLRRSTMSEPHTHHGDVAKGSGILESEIPYEGWRQNGGSVSISESSILESKHGVEQSDEIDGAFLDVGSSEDAYLPDGLRKRRNYRGMKLENRNVIPGIVRDRFPNLQVLHIRGDCY